MPLPALADTGFSLMPRQGLRSLAIGAGAGLGFGCWMALADATVFAAAVPASQQGLLALGHTGLRIVMFARGALLDEVVLRLVAQTGLVWAIMAATGKRGGAAAWPAILLTALVLWPLWALDYFAGLDWSVLTVLREVTLHGAAGVLWGWLCWRHGWLAGVAGHIGAHVALQPLLELMA